MERTAVATAMSHSKRTQELYYQAKKDKEDAVEVYRVMEGVVYHTLTIYISGSQADALALDQ